jgi:hypothetical protein
MLTLYKGKSYLYWINGTFLQVFPKTIIHIWKWWWTCKSQLKLFFLFNLLLQPSFKLSQFCFFTLFLQSTCHNFLFIFYLCFDVNTIQGHSFFSSPSFAIGVWVVIPLCSHIVMFSSMNVFEFKPCEHQ